LARICWCRCQSSSYFWGSPGAFVISAECMDSESNFIITSPTSQFAPPAALRLKLFQTTYG
jgi:hypothetical protein